MKITDFLEIAAGLEWYCAISYGYNSEKLLQYANRDYTEHSVIELSQMEKDGHWSKIMMDAARGLY